MARRHPHGMPPVICTATSKRTGEPCRQYAIVGGTVCFWHGGGRQGRTKDAAERRITLAQLFEQSPREHPWEIVLDATHRMDVIFRDLWAQVVAGETIGTEQLDRLINFNQIRHHLAKTAIDTKAHEQVTMAFTRHLEVEGQLVATALGAAIDKLGLTEPWRVYALEVARHALLGDGAQGDEPQPPEDPIVREYDVRPGTAGPRGGYRHDGSALRRRGPGRRRAAVVGRGRARRAGETRRRWLGCAIDCADGYRMTTAATFARTSTTPRGPAGPPVRSRQPPTTRRIPTTSRARRPTSPTIRSATRARMTLRAVYRPLAITT